MRASEHGQLVGRLLQTHLAMLAESWPSKIRDGLKEASTLLTRQGDNARSLMHRQYGNRSPCAEAAVALRESSIPLLVGPPTPPTQIDMQDVKL